MPGGLLNARPYLQLALSERELRPPSVYLCGLDRPRIIWRDMALWFPGHLVDFAIEVHLPHRKALGQGCSDISLP